MKVGLDTSVVLRLLIGQPEEQTGRATAFLDELARRGDRAVVSDLVVAEVYFALQYRYGVSKRDALAGLRQLFQSDEIEPAGVAAQVLATGDLATAKPGFVDRLIHQGYLREAGSMASFEKAGRKLKSVQAL